MPVLERLERLARGVPIAAFVCLAYACATGEVDDRDGFGPGGDGGAEGSTAVDGSVIPRTDSGASSSSSGGGDSGGDSGGGGPCNGKVVINELMSRGGSASEEFVELYNPGGCAVSLDGWTLRYRSSAGAGTPQTLHTFAASVTVAANGFFVLGTSSFGGTKNVTFNGGLADDGKVGLEDETGKVVDSVGYGAATGPYVEGSPAPKPDNGGSIARKSDGVDTDDNAADFAKSSPHSAGAPNK